MQIQLFISVIIDEIRFDPDDIIEVDVELAEVLIKNKAAQNIKNGILSIEEIKTKEPNFIQLETCVKLAGDFEWTNQFIQSLP